MPRAGRLLVIAAFVVLALSGCRSGISIDSPLYTRPGDWLQFGGNAARSGTAVGGLRPPLREVWREGTAGGQADAAPLAAGGKILVSSVTGGIDIFDPSNGETSGYITVKPVIAGTPLIARDEILLPFGQSETSIGAVSLSTGAILWEKRFGPVESALLGVDDRVVAATRDGKLVCFRASDSATVWMRTVRGGPTAPLAAVDSFLFFPAAGGDLVAYAFGDGAERWRFPAGATLLAAPVCLDGSVFAAFRSGMLVSLEAASGAVRWKRDLAAPVYAAPAAVGEILLVASADGVLRCLSPQTGEERWTFRGSGPVSAPPVIAGEHAVCVSTDGTVRLHALSDGAVEWSVRLNARVKTPPLVHDGMLFVCTEKKEVVAFGGGGER